MEWLWKAQRGWDSNEFHLWGSQQNTFIAGSEEKKLNKDFTLLANAIILLIRIIIIIIVLKGGIL